MKKDNFEDNIYTKLIQWLYWLLMANLCFTLTNFPLLLLTTRGFSFAYLPYYLLASLLLFPAFAALFKCMAQFNDTRELTIVKDYIRFFLGAIRSTLPLSLLAHFMLFVLYVSINYVTTQKQGVFFSALYLIVTVFILCLSLVYLYFLAKNPTVSPRQLLNASFYLGIKKWYVTLINGCLYSLCYGALFVKPSLGFFVLPVIVSGFIYLNSQSFLPESEGHVNEK